MFALELRFEAEPGTAPEAQFDGIGSYIAALVRNGNLLKEWLIATEEHGWTVYAAAPARDAFKKASQNEFVQQRLGKLKEAKVGRPRIRFLSTMPDTASACRCPAPGAYFLFTTFLHTEPPLRCMDCNGVVPLYRLPTPKTGEYSSLLTWEADYKACDTLQIYSTVGVRFGERQMSDLTSSLSKSGLAVCNEIAARTARPVYYYLFRATAHSSSAEQRRKCPSCGGAWRVQEPIYGKFDFKCDKCHLLSNIAWNVRS
jgi:predicted  nucleic acid-binding Zn ribbon protein